ncbi:MAG: hypothetical protein AAF748_10930 [Pseudomonadota bacterium]
MLFQIGFDGCATSALYRLFLESGVRALHSSGQHWRLRGDPVVRGIHVQRKIRDNIASGQAPLTDLSGFDAFFAMHASGGSARGGIIENFRRFDVIAAAYPEAKFLLNRRDLDLWLEARARHGDGTILRRTMAQTGLSAKAVLDLWAADFETHNAHVVAHFLPAPERLLVFDADTTAIDAVVAFAAPLMRLDPRLWQYRGQAAPKPRTSRVAA